MYAQELELQELFLQITLKLFQVFEFLSTILIGFQEFWKHIFFLILLLILLLIIALFMPQLVLQ